MDFASLGFKVDSRELKKGKADLETFGNQGKKTSADIQKSAKTMQNGFNGVATSLKGLMAGIGVIYLLRKAWNMAEISAQFEQSKMAFRSMATAMGADADRLYATLREKSANLIDEKSLTEAANRAMSLGIPIEKLGILMEIARAKARDMGISTTQAFNDIATGVGRGSPLILDNLGLIMKVGSANEAMAKSLGKTVEQLSDKDRKLAILNATIDAGKEALGRYDLSQKTTKEKMEQLTATVANLQLYLGQGLIRAAAGAAGAIYSIASAQLTFLAGYLKLEQAYFRVRSAMSFGKESDMWKMFSMESRNDAQAAMNAAKDLHYQARDSFDAMTASAEDLASAMKQSYVPAVNEAAGATNEMNKMVAEGKAIYSATRTPIEAYIITMEKLNELLKAGAIDQDTYGRASKQALDEMNKATGKTKELADATAEAKRIFEATRTPFENYATTMERLNQLLKMGAIDQDTYGRASKQALDEMNKATEKTKDGFEELKQAIEGWGKESASAIVDFCLTGKASFSDMIQSMISDLMKMILYQQIMKPLAGAISSFAGSLFRVDGLTSIPVGVGVRHKGGLVGYDNPQTRFVNPALFAGAPRLHKGLAPDEYPAILQKGETVIPKGGSIAPTINIINNAGAEISTDMQEVNGGMQIDVMIDQVVAKKMGQFGSSSNKVLRSNFSAKERLVAR